MTRMTTLFAALACSSCGAPGGTGGSTSTEITVADHADPLTSTGQDVLCVLTLSKASAGIDSAALAVFAGLPGKTLTVMNFTVNDTNSNGSLDQGETMTIKEPGRNVFDASTVGQKVSVELNQKVDANAYRLLGSATWLAN